METALVTRPSQKASYLMRVMSFNVQQLLTAQGKSQNELGEYLGMQSSGISLKLSRNNWKLGEAIIAADFLGTTVDALTNDSLMRMLIGDKKADQMLEGDDGQQKRNPPKRVPQLCPHGDSNPGHAD
jgi:hypothetical protein